MMQDIIFSRCRLFPLLLRLSICGLLLRTTGFSQDFRPHDETGGAGEGVVRPLGRGPSVSRYAAQSLPSWGPPFCLVLTSAASATTPQQKQLRSLDVVRYSTDVGGPEGQREEREDPPGSGKTPDSSEDHVEPIPLIPLSPENHVWKKKNGKNPKRSIPQKAAAFLAFAATTLMLGLKLRHRRSAQEEEREISGGSSRPSRMSSRGPRGILNPSKRALAVIGVAVILTTLSLIGFSSLAGLRAREHGGNSVSGAAPSSLSDSLGRHDSDPPPPGSPAKLWNKSTEFLGRHSTKGVAGTAVFAGIALARFLAKLFSRQRTSPTAEDQSEGAAAAASLEDVPDGKAPASGPVEIPPAFSVMYASGPGSKGEKAKRGSGHNSLKKLEKAEAQVKELRAVIKSISPRLYDSLGEELEDLKNASNPEVRAIQSRRLAALSHAVRLRVITYNLSEILEGLSRGDYEGQRELLDEQLNAQTAALSEINKDFPANSAALRDLVIAELPEEHREAALKVYRLWQLRENIVLHHWVHVARFKAATLKKSADESGNVLPEAEENFVKLDDRDDRLAESRKAFAARVVPEMFFIYTDPWED